MAINNNSSKGFGLSTTIFTVFLVLKLTNTITWSWWLVTLPLWFWWAFFLLLFIIAIILEKIYKNKNRY